MSTPTHRVVLDLDFTGFGLSAELVAKGGELLGIASALFDFRVTVPGAVVAQQNLGIATERLLAAGARFDCLVVDIPDSRSGSTTPATGFFRPPTKPLAVAGRRLLSSAPATICPAPAMPLHFALWSAAHALLSDIGEAHLVVARRDFHNCEFDLRPYEVHSNGPERITLVIRGHRAGERRIGQYTPAQAKTFKEILCPSTRTTKASHSPSRAVNC